ncbi:MAG: hypothetical protein ACYS8W_11335 [Planctomycetota bacterium]|jgi:hypothetical protein
MRITLTAAICLFIAAGLTACAGMPKSIVITWFPGQKSPATPEVTDANVPSCLVVGDIVCISIPEMNVVKSWKVRSRYLKPTTLHAVVTEIAGSSVGLEAFRKEGNGPDEYSIRFTGRIKAGDLMYDSAGMFWIGAEKVRTPRMVLAGAFPAADGRKIRARRARARTETTPAPKAKSTLAKAEKE